MHPTRAKSEHKSEEAHATDVVTQVTIAVIAGKPSEISGQTPQLAQPLQSLAKHVAK